MAKEPSTPENVRSEVQSEFFTRIDRKQTSPGATAAPLTADLAEGTKDRFAAGAVGRR